MNKKINPPHLFFIQRKIMSTRSILLTGLLLFSLEYILLCFTFESSQTIVQDKFPVDIISSIPDLQHPQSLVPLLNALELGNVQIDSINPSTTKLQFSSQNNNTALQIQKTWVYRQTMFA